MRVAQISGDISRGESMRVAQISGDISRGESVRVVQISGAISRGESMRVAQISGDISRGESMRVAQISVDIFCLVWVYRFLFGSYGDVGDGGVWPVGGARGCSLTHGYIVASPTEIRRRNQYGMSRGNNSG